MSRQAAPDPGGVESAERILRAGGVSIRTSFPLAPLTSFRIGGPAAIYVEPQTESDLRAVAEAVGTTGLSWVVIGKGSNLLVSDWGFPGIVLRLGKGYRWTAREGLSLRAGGAMALPALSGVALSHSLTGLEFGVAIPASLGGAVRMNAGAHGRSMQDVVQAIELFSMDRGAALRIGTRDAGMAYRQTGLPADALVVGATLSLQAGDRTAIRGEMDRARSWRKATQPLAEPNCGSVFKNPPGDHAARLVEAAGAKGMSLGGARVSTKHANFIVAGAGSKAEDVHALIVAVRRLVLERFGIPLEPEVQLVGDFDLESV